MNSQAKAGKGLLVIYTGNGKGKTTAALGQAVRAAGQGLQVCFIQFIKGKWQTGESKLIAGIDRIEFHTLGSGFTWQAKDKAAVIATAQKAWQLAEEKIMSDRFEMVILDELTYLVSYGMISEAELLQMVANRPARQHLVITGRNACAALIQAADLVTEMTEIKHHFKNGVPAEKGIEY